MNTIAGESPQDWGLFCDDYRQAQRSNQYRLQIDAPLRSNGNLHFEFLMSEKPNGAIRNHGYPWRLIRADFLDQLFAFQIKLR